MNAFIAFLAAVGVGTILAALVSHLTAISNYRQAWINALRDDLAEYFKSLEKMNYVIGDYLQDSVKVEEKRRSARLDLLFVYERIRLRLNRVEELHIQLEGRLREFLDNPLGQMLADRIKIDEAVDLSRRVLKYEWEATKYPWKGFLKQKDGKMNWPRGAFRLWVVLLVMSIAFAAWHMNLPLTLSAYWNGYPTQQILNEEKATGIEMFLDKDGVWKKCVPPPLKKDANGRVSEKDFFACVFSPLDDTPPITRNAADASLQEFAIDAFVPPLAIAAICLALLWVACGFRRNKANSI